MNKTKQTLQAFGTALRETMEVYDKPVSDDALRVWWGVLEEYSLEQVRGGLTRHLRDPERGRFAPKPADVIAGIRSAYLERWPTADQCWPIAKQASDESETVVWPCEEAREAWHAAGEPLCTGGDEIGAHLAFQRVYRELVDRAIRQGRMPAPSVSVGHDPQRRSDPINRAVESGLLTQEAASKLLPAPPLTQDGKALTTLMLAGPDEVDPEDMRRKLGDIKRQIQGRIREDRKGTVHDPKKAEAERKRQTAIVDRAHAAETT